MFEWLQRFLARGDAPVLPTILADTTGISLTVGDVSRAIPWGAIQRIAAFKQDLTALLVDKLAPIAAETRRLLADPGTVDATLRAGAAKAEALALPIVDQAERLVGFLKG